MALRVMTQIQSDQRNLFQIQSQLSSGRRINAPSEDAPAAARAMTLQSLLERKTSVKASINTIQTSLSASESALGVASSLLIDVRALALSVVGNAASSDERNAAVTQINNAIDQLISVGNQSFQGNYLFSGSQTQTLPFAKTQSGIAYYGNDTALSSYSDVDQLFKSNVTGQQVFGAYSDSLRGTTDLNPVVTFGTKLTDLNNGNGVRIGSIALTDGNSTSIVNIAGASTIGDVARMLEANPPGNRTVTARVTSQGLDVSLDGGNLSILEVGSGTTAAELGIKRLSGVGPGPVVGVDLNPKLTLNTRLADTLGSRARAYLPAVGTSNDLVVEANQAGTEFNGVTIKYVDDDWFQSTPGITVGNEFATYHATATSATSVLKFPGRAGLDNGIQLTATTPGATLNNTAVTLNMRTVDGLGPQVTYNATTKVYAISVETGSTVDDLQTAINTGGGPFTMALTPSGVGTYAFSAADINANAGNTYATGNDANTLAVHIDSGKTSANQVIAAIAAQGQFTARLDVSEELSDGNGVVDNSAADITSWGITAGGSGQEFDRSGLQITNGGQSYTVDLAQAQTVEDLLNAINGVGANVIATINASGNGIDVRSRLSGSDFSIGESGGATASQLGIRSLTTTTSLSVLNHGDGVHFSTNGDDFQITRRDGVSYGIRLAQGSVASARLDGAAANGDLLFSRVASGTAGNAFQVQIVDSGIGGGNNVSLVGNVLRYDVDVAAGFTAQDAVDLLAADSTLSTQFTAQLDRSTDTTNAGTGSLAVATASFVGGKGAAATLGDVVDLINNHPTNLASGPAVTARLAATGNGIELVNDGPGGTGTLTVRKLNSSSAAVELGLIPNTGDVSNPAIVGNSAAATILFPGSNNDLVITARSSGTLLNGVVVHFQDDGIAGNNSVSYDPTLKRLTFDVDPATTSAQDLVNLLSSHPQFSASIKATDGGLPNTGGGLLGLFPADSILSGGSADVLTGTDPNPQEVDGVFSALVRLREAVISGDQTLIQRAMDQLDRGMTNLNFTRAEVGARMNSLDIIQNRLDAENIAIKSSLSIEIEVDFAAAISELAQKQAAFQASLQVSATLAQTTLLDFI